MNVFEKASDPTQEVLSTSLAGDWLDGVATIVQLQATGRIEETLPELQFELVLEVAGHQSTVNHIQVVPRELLGQLRSGRRVAVRVDPDDHSQLMIGGAP